MVLALLLLALSPAAAARLISAGVAAAAPASARPADRHLQQPCTSQCPDSGKPLLSVGIDLGSIWPLATLAIDRGRVHPLVALGPSPAAAASATCSALGSTRQDAIRNSLIASCSNVVLAGSSGGAGQALKAGGDLRRFNAASMRHHPHAPRAPPPACAGTCCDALAPLSQSEWQETLSCMW